MKHGIHFTTVVGLAIGTVFAVPTLKARTCSGNGDVIGSYGFSGTRSGFFLLGATASGNAGGGPLIPVPISPPGTTGVSTVIPAATGTQGPIVGSNTPIGALVAGLNNLNVFSSVGRVYADGLGNFFSSTAATTPSSTTVAPNINTLVGTYSVGSDCSIVVTLGDPFMTNSTGGTNVAGNLGIVTNGVMNVGANSVTLEGELVQTSNSTEIYLVGTSRNMAGARVTLLKTSEAGSCSNASLFGNFGVVADGVFSATAGSGINGGVGSGTATGSTGTGTLASTDAFTNGATGPLGTPFSLLGRFYADGNGNLVNDALSATSTLKRNVTGTYTVNSDCSGTARLVDQAGVSRNIGFVLANEFAACSAGGGVSSLSRQRLHFVFTDSGVIGSGTARLQ